MNVRKLLSKVLTNTANARFADMQKLAVAFGFQLLRISGSHHIYGRVGIIEQVKLQNVGGRANRIRFASF